MSDKYNCLTVALEKEVSEDYAHYIIDAIKMIKGVLDVTPHAENVIEFTYQARADRRWRDALLKLLQENH